MRASILAILITGLGFATAAAAAEDTFGAKLVAPAAREFHVGALRLTALHDAQFVLPNDAKTFGVDAGTAAVSDALRSATAPTDRITLSVNALLVRSGARLLLIDTGIGAKSHGSLLASLHAAGVRPAAVTDVLITHSHGDHVGGLVDDSGRPAFPRATIRMANAEWAWMQKQGPAELVKAIATKVRGFEPGAQIAPGVKSVALDGHTPGHMGYEISSGKARLLDIGDLAHSAILSLHQPQWTMGFDNDPVLAKTTRQATLARLAQQQELVFAPHFPFPGVGHVVAAGDTFAWQPGVP